MSIIILNAGGTQFPLPDIIPEIITLGCASLQRAGA